MSVLRLSALFATFALALLAAPAFASSTENSDILGTWKLTKVLDYADVTAMDDDQAAKLVGQTLDVRKGGITFAGEPCQNTSLERHRVDTVRYIRENYHAATTHLGLPDPVTVVHLTCTEAFVKSKNRIVVFWDGVFFDATKESPGKPGAMAKR